MANINLLLVAMPLIWVLWGAFSLFTNYQKASRLHLPMVFAPVSPDNPIWIAIQTAFPIGFQYVPFRSIPWIRYCRLGWEFHDQYKTHERLGDAWMLVKPNQNWLYVAQNDATVDILSRSRDSARPVWTLGKSIFPSPDVSLSC